MKAKEQARQRGMEIVLRDLQESGGSYVSGEVCQLLGITPERLEALVSHREILRVLMLFPVVQFKSDGTIVEGLPAVLDALPTKNESAALNFLVNPDDRLGYKKPIDLLKTGEIDLVVKAARCLGEMGA